MPTIRVRDNLLIVYLDDNELLIDDEFMKTYINKYCDGIVFTCNNNAKRQSKLLPIQFKLSSGCLAQYVLLKVINIEWTSLGITDEMFTGCNNLKRIMLGTPNDKPLKKFDTLINLPKLENITINGFGMADLSEEFVSWYTENNKDWHIHKKGPRVDNLI